MCGKLMYRFVILVVDRGYDSILLLCTMRAYNGAKYICSTHTYSSSRVVRKENIKEG